MREKACYYERKGISLKSPFITPIFCIKIAQIGEKPIETRSETDFSERMFFQKREVKLSKQEVFACILRLFRGKKQLFLSHFRGLRKQSVDSSLS